MGDQYPQQVGDTMFVAVTGGDCDGDDKMSMDDKFTARQINGWKRPFREFMGTYIFLVLAFGISACNGAAMLNVAVAYGLGLAVAAFLFGCDANPAVSLTKLIMRRGKRPFVFLIMIIAQFIAAVLAAVTINYGFDCDISAAVATPAPGLAYGQTLVIEMILTMILVCAACMQFAAGSIASALQGVIAGIALLVCILVGGGLTGAALNPFRALAPSMFSHFPADAWVYYVAWIIASVLAALILTLAKTVAPKCQKQCMP